MQESEEYNLENVREAIRIFLPLTSCELRAEAESRGYNSAEVIPGK